VTRALLAVHALQCQQPADPLRDAKMSQNESGQSNLLNVNQAADRLGVSVSYLNKLRLISSGGPRFVKLGARVSYDPSDLAAWVESNKRRSTSDQGAPA